MAFFGRVGNILKHATNRKINSELCSFPFPSVFQTIRCFSNPPSTKLFVGGVSYATDEQSFREMFSKYGQVVDVKIITDRETGRSKGFGFITYSTVDEASSAIQALDGQDVQGRRIGVNFATQRPRGFGGGGGGGGFNGSHGNISYGAGGGTGYTGGYGNSPYGAASGVGGYGDAGGNVPRGNGSGGYGGRGYESGSNFGGSSRGNDYNAYDNTRGASGSYSGSRMNHGNDGSYAGGNTYNNGTSGGYGVNNAVNYGNKWQ